ncbi:MAG: hypothetical protein A3G93_00070 [Nitrospinae bacterium RIFCSPLOWO2_12_FULL_45_22]|nr:MAG: hypothetical protein A3G93_00070 [Nitrospinae bacterium RIFCSPLOWO2_12_FULL_45_22]
MREFCLQSRQDSVKTLANFFFKAGEDTSSDRIMAILEVGEGICFKEGSWLSVGEIELYPGTPVAGDENPYSLLERALTLGSYDWKLPELDNMLDRAIKIVADKDIEKKRNKLTKVLEGVAHVALRCGFTHPVFDAESLSNMPFKKPTTVVADTSSVLHGGLDFVVRFLYPVARIKIPAVVHMEILNIADRYFNQRRDKKTTVGALFDHINSQGGQRVLLRLELQTDAEIERPRLGSDPLRGIVQPDTDPEDRSLGLQNVQRSFADRLILETAIQHRERVSSDHPVMLLTCDQGLARMTLGEGMQPLFFDKNYCCHLFGTVLTGTCFCPFLSSPNSDRLYFIPLMDLIWELAVTYGSARIVNKDCTATFEVRAIGKTLSWSPFHAKDDLLWVRWDGFNAVERLAELKREESGILAEPLRPRPEEKAGKKDKASQDQKPLKGSYKFSLPSMLSLIQAFLEKQMLTNEEGIAIVGVKTLDSYEKYRNFLRSGDFIIPAKKGFEKTEKLDKLWETILLRDYPSLELLLAAVPSFRNFREELMKNKLIIRSKVASVADSPFSTYCGLAEMVCIGLQIPEEGLRGTFVRPTLEEFSKIAVDCYAKIAQGEEYILTGQWLEALAREYGVHPVLARSRLDEAYQAGYLQRYTEGSTPETQFEKHIMTYLNVEKGIPVIERINLYHGDFILPDRTSVSIRIIQGR